MDNKKIMYWVGGIVVCIIGFFGLNAFLNKPTDTKESSVDNVVGQAEVISVDNIVVPDQAGSSKIFVEKVLLKTNGKGGYVVIHRTAKDGTPGVIIGVSKYLEPGVNDNIVVPLNSGETVAIGDKLIAMLHGDNGDTIWNDATLDAPILREDGSNVMWKFSILDEKDLPGFEQKL